MQRGNKEKGIAAAMPGQSLGSPLVLSCSPRAGGNCDTAAALYAKAFSAARGLAEPLPVEYLRRYTIGPCVACGRCDGQTGESLYAQAAGPGHGPQERPDLSAERRAGSGDAPGLPERPQKTADSSGPNAPGLWKCPVSLKDDSAYLLRRLAMASSVCLVSPIFFYHLPAQFKALLDRLQPVWQPPLPASEKSARLFARRLCKCILVAARPRGDKLFEGSLLSLKLALAGLNLELAEPLLLRGLDAPGALAADKTAVSLVEQYALSPDLS